MYELIKLILLLSVFAVILLSTWCFVNVQDYKDITDCMLIKIGYKKSKDNDDDNDNEAIRDNIEDVPKEDLKCMFKTNDILSGKIYTKEGNLLADQPNITCADCTKYVYKDNDGSCYKFIHDSEYNADDYCLENETGECIDACTAQFKPIETGCPF